MYCKRCRNCTEQVAAPESVHHCDFTGGTVFPNTELRADWCPLELSLLNYDQRQAAISILRDADRRGKLPDLLAQVNGFRRMQLEDLMGAERVTA